MKRIFVTLVVVLSASVFAIGQKVGYVNTQTILSALPEYKDTVAVLESRSKVMQTRIDDAFKTVENLYNSYQETKYNITQDRRKQIEDEIIARERAATALQKEYFGQDGKIAKESEAALKAIKERVQKAVDAVAKEGGYSIVMDIAALQGIMYNDEKCDLSSKVIEKLK